MVTFSYQVTAIARSNFKYNLHGNFAKAFVTFTSQIGKMSIQYYSEPTESRAVDPDHAFICIPYIYPGRDKWDSNNSEVRRLMGLSTHLLFLVGNFAMKQLDEYSGSTLPTSKILCKEIIDAVKGFLGHAPGGQAFAQAFAEAKLSLQVSWSSLYNRAASENACPILDRLVRKLIADLGEVEGDPSSIKRRHQLQKL